MTESEVESNFVFDARSINKFLKSTTARPIREGHVGDIKAYIKLHGSISTPIFVNNINNGTGGKSYRVIDGHHRLEAIKQLINEDPNFSMKGIPVIYNDLSESQELEKFDEINAPIPTNTMDRLWAHQKFTPIISKILKSFPVPVDFGQIGRKPNSPWLPAGILLAAHLSIGKTAIPYLSKRNYHLVLEMNDNDYNIMVAFGEDLKKIAFDLYGRNSIFKIMTLGILYRVWYLNCIEVPFSGSIKESRELFCEKARKAFIDWPSVKETFREANKAGKASIVQVRAEEEFVSKMNLNRRKQKIKATYEVWKKEKKTDEQEASL